ESAPDPTKTDAQGAAVIPDPEVPRARDRVPSLPPRLGRRRRPGPRRTELIHVRHRVASATGRHAALDIDVAGREQDAAGWTGWLHGSDTSCKSRPIGSGNGS